MTNKRKTTFLIPLAAAGVLFAVIFGYTAALSFVNYKPIRGLLGSQYVGLSNFARLFQTAQTMPAIGHSILHSMLLSAAGLPLGLLLTQALASAQRSIKAALAGLFLVIALFPDLLWMLAIQSVTISAGMTNFFTDPMLYPVVLLAAKLIPQTALCAFGGLCLSLSGSKNAAAGAITVGMLPALTAFLPDLRSTLMLSNAMTQSASETLTSLAYRQSLMMMNFGLGGAAGLTGMLLSLFLGVGAAVVIGSTAEKPLCAPRAALASDKRMSDALTAASGGLFAALAALALTPRGGETDVLLSRALTNTLACAIGAAIVAFGVCVLVIACFRDGSGVCLGLFAMLLLLTNAIGAGNYLLARSLGMLNTIVPVVLGVVSHPVFIAVVLVLTMCRPANDQQLMLCAAGGAAAAAALCAGDWLYATVFISSTAQMPLAGLVRTTVLSGKNAGAWLMAAICLALAIGAAALIAAGVSAEEQTEE